MAKRHRHRNTAAVQEARAATYLKFNPEASALSELLRQSASDYRSQVQVEQGAARGVAKSANAAVPKVKGFYRQAADVGTRQQAFINDRVGQLGPGADDIKAAIAQETAGYQRRLGETRASTLSEFKSRVADAKAGAAFALQNARQQYRGDVGKIEDRIVQLGREKGVFAAATLAQIKKTNADAARINKQNAVTNRVAIAGITGVDPVTGKPTYKKQNDKTNRDAKRAADKAKAAKAKADKAKAARKEKRTAGRDFQHHYNKGVSLAKGYAQGGYVPKLNRAGEKIKRNGKTVTEYVDGASQQEIVDLLTPKLDGDRLAARAAAQTVLHGGVGPHTRRKAHQRYLVRLPSGKGRAGTADFNGLFGL